MRAPRLASLAAFALVALAACKKEESKQDPVYEPPTRDYGHGPGFTAEAMVGPMKGDPVSSARILVEDLGKADFDGAMTIVNAEAKKSLDAKKLAATWTKSLGDAGTYVRIQSASVEDLGAGKSRVRVRATLTKGTVDVFVGFEQGKDEATFVEITRGWTLPAYYDADKIVEHDLVVGEGARALPATLTRLKELILVNGKAPLHPAVLLVSGAGPNDRDDALPGGARPFRDLAIGLASKGVTVLRYEKRTYAGHAAAVGLTNDNVTLKDEYLTDVEAAIATLRATDGVDARRILVLGQGEGGWLVPMFFAADPQLAGGIMLAGNARSLEDAYLSRLEYLASLPNATVTKAMVDDAKKRVDRVKKLTPTTKLAASELPLDLGVPYWLEVRRYDPVAVATKVKKPTLILQGGRDCQVTEKDDFALWKKALEARPDVRFAFYPTLNHAFFAGEGPIVPDEYASQLGHVDVKVIEDVAAFALQVPAVEPPMIIPSASASASAAPSASVRK